MSVCAKNVRVTVPYAARLEFSPHGQIIQHGSKRHTDVGRIKEGKTGFVWFTVVYLYDALNGSGCNN